MKPLFCLLALSTLILPYHALSQQDSSSLQKKMVEAVYRTNVSAASPLYNGPEYFYNDQLLTDHAFLETPAFDKGSVTIDGVTFNDVPLAYDILRDELVTLSYSSDFKVKMLREKISGFTLRNRRFIAVKGSSIPEGYYEVLYSGKTQVLARREKRVKELTNAGRDVVYQVNSFNTYYILTSSGYERISDRASLLNVFADKRTELNSFLNSNRFSFPREMEEALIQSTRYYDQIKNQ